MRILHLIACSMISAVLIAAEPDAESGASFDLANEIFSLLQTREAVVSGFRSTFAPFLSRVPKDKKESVQKATAAFAESIADSPELRERIILLYTKSFSESELRDMAAFYRTPTGKKAAGMFIELTQKANDITQEITDQKQPALETELEKILKTETK